MAPVPKLLRSLESFQRDMFEVILKVFLKWNHASKRLTGLSTTNGVQSVRVLGSEEMERLTVGGTKVY